MTVTPVEWPAVLKPVDFGYSLLDSDVSGGQAVGGGEQFIASAGPRWAASMTLDVTNNEKVLALRALRVQLMGRVVPVKLPNFDGKRLSWPEQRTAGGDATGVILHPGITRNKELDDTFYADPEIPDVSEIEATVDNNYAIRATTIDIEVTQGGAVFAGQQFGIGDYLYEVGTVSGFGPGGGPIVYTVTFLPPLREAVTTGTEVKFTRPWSLMRCMNLNDEFRKLEKLRTATVNLEFVEYV